MPAVVLDRGSHPEERSGGTGPGTPPKHGDDDEEGGKATPSFESLPDGWIKAFDAASGRMY